MRLPKIALEPPLACFHWITGVALHSGREDLQADLSKIVAAAEQLLGQINRLISLTEVGIPEAIPASRIQTRDLVAEIMRSIQPIASKPKAKFLSGRILVVDDTDANRESAFAQAPPPRIAMIPQMG